MIQKKKLKMFLRYKKERGEEIIKGFTDKEYKMSMKISSMKKQTRLTFARRAYFDYLNPSNIYYSHSKFSNHIQSSICFAHCTCIISGAFHNNDPYLETK